LPRAAAVTIKSTSKDISYADILKRARSKFALAELGVEAAKIRKAANGGLLIEIPGPDGGAKADLLADWLRTVLGEEETVARPVRMGEVQLLGFDISVSVEEIREAIAANKYAS